MKVLTRVMGGLSQCPNLRFLAQQSPKEGLLRVESSGQVSSLEMLLASKVSCFFAVCSFCTFLGFAQADAWKEYVYADDGFAITAPSEPSVQKRTMKPVAGEVEAHIYIIRLDNAQLMLIYAPLHPNDKRTPEQALNDSKKALNITDSKLVNEKNISLGDYPGLELELEYAQYHQRGRYYVAERRAYALIVETYKDVPFPPEAQRWYDSFRLVSKDKTRQPVR